jgi:Ca2+-binding EF-hand superfamily protein
MTQEEEEKCWEAFSAMDRDGNGYINQKELRIMLEVLGNTKLSKRDVKRVMVEADLENYGNIRFPQFKRIISQQKQNNAIINELDTFDAFVAMGGDPSGAGSIDAPKLIKILRDDFEMTIDIEKLIKDIDEDGSGAIEYEEFRKLLGHSKA